MGFNKSFIVDSIGRSGGLAFFWKDQMDVELESYTKIHISLKIIQPDKSNKWILTGFYGNPLTAKRAESWRLLKALKPSELGMALYA